MSKSNRDKTRLDAPYLPARPAQQTSDLSTALPVVSAAPQPQVRSVWRPVVRLSAAGEGAFTDTSPNPQPLFLTKYEFFAESFDFFMFSITWLSNLLLVRRLFLVFEGPWDDSAKALHKM